MAEATHASPLPLQRRGLRQAKAHYCQRRRVVPAHGSFRAPRFVRLLENLRQDLLG